MPCTSCGGRHHEFGDRGCPCRCHFGGQHTMEQPAPVPTEHPPSWEAVITDLTKLLKDNPEVAGVIEIVRNDAEHRDLEGRRKYGVPLQPHNGRNANIDCYQELLDAAVYRRTKLLETSTDYRTDTIYLQLLALLVTLKQELLKP